ncbi:hypothetical protein BDP81DRAFT_468400 [Colletotrichum phormii]|uniref:F-box domain-containing protein n=1 Tax=Colletotrichum phormii TaxID=359342 RepID=A0AAJ0A2A5_9PEZI|nr:uncharacterized protein BDP81DRAFT_468400 [Colletotrichum phormii]KAK1655116.1 hypothetical protein BDP81DRAFT_468400 [Colletotrichum phormii]
MSEVLIVTQKAHSRKPSHCHLHHSQAAKGELSNTDGKAPTSSDEDQSLQQGKASDKLTAQIPMELNTRPSAAVRGASATSQSRIARHLTLEGLPAELQLQVLRNLSNLHDLSAVIHASPSLHRSKTFHTHRVFVDAFAVHRLALLRESGSEETTELLEEFMDTYSRLQSDPGSFRAACTVDDLAEIARFYSSTVEPLKTSFYEEFRCHKRSIWVEREDSNKLSTTENVRMLRALYHFEIWCSCYGLGSSAVQLLPMTTNIEMLRFMNKHFEPWEIEELACIYVQTRDRMSRLLTYSADNGPHRLDRSAELKFQKLSTPEFFDLSNTDTFWYFVETLASRGLGRFHTMNKYDEILPPMQRELSIALRNLKFQGTIMQEESDDEIAIMNLQLSGGGGNRLDEDRRELPFDGDKENGPPFGWVLLWGGTYSNSLGGRTPDTTLKDWGYVFWDKESIPDFKHLALNEMWNGGLDPRDHWD